MNGGWDVPQETYEAGEDAEEIARAADHDGAPYCSACGARHKRYCTCEPIAENE